MHRIQRSLRPGSKPPAEPRVLGTAHSERSVKPFGGLLPESPGRHQSDELPSLPNRDLRLGRRVVEHSRSRHNGNLPVKLGDVLTVWSVGDGAHFSSAARRRFRHNPIGRKVAGRSGVRCTVKRRFESLFFRPVWRRQAEMPFPDVPGAVSRVTQRFRQSVVLRIQINAARRKDQSAVRWGICRITGSVGRLWGKMS